MKEEQQIGEELNKKEFLELFKKLMSSEETKRENVSKSLAITIGNLLFDIQLVTHDFIKETEKKGQSAENYKKYITSTQEIIDLIGIIKNELFPDHIRFFGLEKSLEIYSRYHAEKMPRTIKFNSEIEAKKLDSFSEIDQLNIYRIYTSCLYYLVFDVQALDFTVNLNNLDNEISLDFLVNTINPYINLNNEQYKQQKNYIAEIIKARLILLGGRIDEKTDWLNRIRLCILLPNKIDKKVNEVK